MSVSGWNQTSTGTIRDHAWKYGAIQFDRTLQHLSEDVRFSDLEVFVTTYRHLAERVDKVISLMILADIESLGAHARLDLEEERTLAQFTVSLSRETLNIFINDELLVFSPCGGFGPSERLGCGA